MSLRFHCDDDSMSDRWDPRDDIDPNARYEMVLCSNCNGSGEGMYDGSRCSSCGGKGEVPEEIREEDEEPCDED